jgi:hypothetical protein
MITKFRAQFDGKALIPLEPVNLQAGQVLQIEATESDEFKAGSPQAILHVMQSLPAIPSSDVEELLSAIAASQLPAVNENIFGEEKKQ